MPKKEKQDWPAWFNGPNGQTAVFNAPGEVPAGWTSGAEKRTVDAPKPAAGRPPKAKEAPKAPLDL